MAGPRAEGNGRVKATADIGPRRGATSPRATKRAPRASTPPCGPYAVMYTSSVCFACDRSRMELSSCRSRAPFGIPLTR